MCVCVFCVCVFVCVCFLCVCVHAYVSVYVCACVYGTLALLHIIILQFIQLHVSIKGTGKLFDVGSRKCQAKLEGHEGDVSKVT